MSQTKAQLVGGVGISTANDFTIYGGLIGVAATFTGNVSVGGTLIYEDVTNVDSIGLITARSGVIVNTGTATTALIVNGDARVTGILTVGTSSITLDGSENQVNVGTGVTIYGNTGIVSATKFYGDGSELSGVGFSIGAGSTASPSLAPTGDSNTGIFFPSADTVAVSYGGTEALRVDSSGRLGIGTENAASQLHVYKSGDGQTPVTLQTGNANGTLRFYNDSNGWSIDSGGDLRFVTSRTSSGTPERINISSTGLVNITDGSTYYSSQTPVRFGIRKDSASTECLAFVQGHGGNSSGSNTYALRVAQNADNNSNNSAALRIDHTNPAGGSGGSLIQAFGNLGNATTQKTWEVYSYGGHLINLPAFDGTLIQFQQAQTNEGSISVSGSTVSYNGAHLSRWSQLPGGAERIEILRGTVLSNVDEMCEWINPPTEEILWTEEHLEMYLANGEDGLPNGAKVGDVKEPATSGVIQENEQLNRMKVSDVEGDKNVAGVFQSWDDEDDTYINDFYCAMTGDFIIRIAEGVTVQRGDLLMSAGDGTAKPQGDGFVQDKTIAKVTSTHVTCTYEDGSYCVPCVLMSC